MTPRASERGTAKLVIGGGGVAALEAALAVRDMAGDRVEVEIWSPRREFVYRPLAVGEPFGVAGILRYDLAGLAEACGASFRLGGLVAVDAEARRATARDGGDVAYDYLLLAPGARMLWSVPGAVTFWGVADEGGVGAVVHKLRVGRLRDVVFTMPGGNNWALPLYELALLARSVLAKSGIEDARLTVATPEQAPLGLFGLAVGEEMSALLRERRIEVVTGVHPVGFDGERLSLAPGGEIETEAVVALPRLEGRRIDGAPHDEDGFIAVDEHAAAIGVERVFAAGDVTTFPVKQGGIATQQADAAAAAIAAAVGAPVEPTPFDPTLRGVLWTGAEPRYLYGRLTGGTAKSRASPRPRRGGRRTARSSAATWRRSWPGSRATSSAAWPPAPPPPSDVPSLVCPYGSISDGTSPASHDAGVRDGGADRELIRRFRGARRDRALAVLEGFHALKHALRFGAEPEEAVTCDRAQLEDLAAELAPDVAGRLTAVATAVPAELLAELVPQAPRTGVVAIAHRPAVEVATLLTDPREAPLVLLEDPRTMGNLGACVRVAAAAGAAGVLTIGSNDPWHPDALRAAAGLHYALPVTAVEVPPPSDRPLVAVDPEGERLRPAELPPRAVLAFGTERHGLSAELLGRADARLGIPMRAGVSSLNLATAVAAVLFAQRL